MMKFEKGGHSYVRTKLTAIRQHATRAEGGTMLGGRKHRDKPRPQPSLPKLKCLEPALSALERNDVESKGEGQS